MGYDYGAMKASLSIPIRHVVRLNHYRKMRLLSGTLSRLGMASLACLDLGVARFENLPTPRKTCSDTQKMIHRDNAICIDLHSKALREFQENYVG